MARPYALLSLTAALLLSGGAQAHQLWLEQTAASAHLYYGEFDRNLREASPGRLDKLTPPTAAIAGGASGKALTLTREANAFALSARAGKDETIFVEEAASPVVEYKVNDVPTRAARTLAARLITSDAQQAPKLTLDLLPTGKPGEFRVYYKGQPLAKTRVGIIVQSGWAREARSDDQGIVKFDLPWKGSYVLEVRHADKTPGERAGRPYDVANFMTTLSLTRDEGLDPLPAHPPAIPGK
ncbi:MAG TPA: DUF4198 domain-containing protein [Burkholderiaceae bacterium]|nr:DUF4198 domain-containing protein [Burkholderiaceae bacterium]